MYKTALRHESMRPQGPRGERRLDARSSRLRALLRLRRSRSLQLCPRALRPTPLRPPWLGPGLVRDRLGVADESRQHNVYRTGGRDQVHGGGDVQQRHPREQTSQYATAPAVRAVEREAAEDERSRQDR